MLVAPLDLGPLAVPKYKLRTFLLLMVLKKKQSVSICHSVRISFVELYSDTKSSFLQNDFKYNIFFDTLFCNGLKSIHYLSKYSLSASVSFIPGANGTKKKADSIPSGAAVFIHDGKLA
jgi:hypothetical protein